ncbi:chaperonin GroEL [Methylomonas sp. MgM2]
MAKQIVYNPEARLRMLQGMETLARAAGVTLGSHGPAVMIQHRTDGIVPVYTRDGATVANAIVFEDRIADLGARMLRDVAGTMSRQVGDGTTTAIVLAQKIAVECMKSVEAGFHPLQLKKGLELALMLVEQDLAQQSITEMSDGWVEKIASIATKDEPDAGALLARAFDELGTDGVLTFELGNGRRDELDIVEGIHYEQGYLSPYFVTDKNRNAAVLDQPYVLLYDREITDLIDLVPILEQVADQNRSLLIIAENIQEHALAPLLLNHVRGVFKVAAVKPPGFGDKRIDRLNDLALMTGGRALLEGKAGRLDQVTLAQLGQAKRAVITAEKTSIIGAAGNTQVVKQLAERLKQQAAAVRARKPGDGSPTGNQHEAEELEERFAMLSGRIGRFGVGGVTDIEIKERLVRIENAYRSAKAALEEGVLPGGGIGLYRARQSIGQVIAENAEQQQGIAILHLALAAPLQKLLNNAGLSREEIIARIDCHDDRQLAFDTRDGRFGHFLEIGVMDPVKVVRLALRNAVSVMTTLMSTESVIMDVPDTSVMAGYSPEWAAATREDPRV